MRMCSATLFWLLTVVTCALPASAGDWSEYSTPHFQLYSNASDTQAQDWVVSLAKLSYLIPRFGDSRAGEFKVLVLSDYALYQKIKPHNNTAGFVQKIDRDTYIIIGRELKPREPALQKRYIFNLYSQHYLLWSNARYSSWWYLGLAEVLSQTQFEAERAVIGIDRSFLNAQAALPIESLLFDSSATRAPDYRSNAGALVNYLLFGSVNGYPQYADALSTYFAPDQPLTKERFEQALGYPLAQLQADYSRYLQEPSLKAAAVKFPAPDTLFDKRLMSSDEVNGLMARLLITHNEIDYAKKYLKKIAKHSPQYQHINSQLETLQAQQNQLAAAEKQLKKEPGNEATLVHAANSYVEQSRQTASDKQRKEYTQTAITYALRALQINPDNYDMHQLLRGGYLMTHERDKAFFHLQEQLRLQPDNALNNAAVATFYLRQKEEAKARFYFAKACELDPQECERGQNQLQDYQRSQP